MMQESTRVCIFQFPLWVTFCCFQLSGRFLWLFVVLAGSKRRCLCRSLNRCPVIMLTDYRVQKSTSHRNRSMPLQTCRTSVSKGELKQFENKRHLHFALQTPLRVVLVQWCYLGVSVVYSLLAGIFWHHYNVVDEHKLPDYFGNLHRCLALS